VHGRYLTLQICCDGRLVHVVTKYDTLTLNVVLLHDLHLLLDQTSLNIFLLFLVFHHLFGLIDVFLIYFLVSAHMIFSLVIIFV
jgi:hypothetical protein